MPHFLFEFVSPERLLFTGTVEDVIVRARRRFTVLKDHSPLMTDSAA